MTKFMQKSFSVYNNYRTDKCDQCGKESNYYVQSKEGKLCTTCYQNRKQKEAEERIKKIIRENSRSL